jgi:hypothetical protein
MKEVLARLRANHAVNPGATVDEVSAAESRLGVSFPQELRALFAAANGGLVWEASSFPARLLATSEVEFVARLIPADEDGPTGLVAILRQEADVVAIDLNPESPNFGFLVDCCHETFPYELGLVSETLQGMLELLLASEGEEWVWPAVLASGRDLASNT